MRPIHQIARDIQLSWKNPYFGAKPYLEAMLTIDKPTDSYFDDSAKEIILYFLANATTWRGETARQIKNELNQLIK